MGSRNRDRLPGLWLWTIAPPGSVRMAVCKHCRHMAPVPVNDLVRRYGKFCPLDEAIKHLRCVGCRRGNVEVQVIPLCEPGCRQRRNLAC